ncbi:MAG: rhomboid family intramembrane serine protease [Candidatus Helarchaeota archaeon]
MAVVWPRLLRAKPIFTLILIIVNIMIFIWSYVLANPLFFEYQIHVSNLGFTPSDFFNGRKVWTILTSMFLHGDILHILFNMFYFFLFSVDVEASLGRISYILLYFFSGICGNLLYGLYASVFGNPNIPTIGASGAIFGIMGAYLVLFPNNEAYIMYRYLIRTRAFVAILFYIALETFLGIFVYTDGVAHFAHIGGFLGAVFFVYVIYRQCFRDKYEAIKRNY